MHAGVQHAKEVVIPTGEREQPAVRKRAGGYPHKQTMFSNTRRTDESPQVLRRGLQVIPTSTEAPPIFTSLTVIIRPSHGFHEFSYILKRHLVKSCIQKGEMPEVNNPLAF